ncbi:hypothetical protein TNCV_395991 [Trichonephila clavipes]|nr:hypothetical protein TNCV_395991 [Trichonephila clavipes]
MFCPGRGRKPVGTETVERVATAMVERASSSILSSANGRSVSRKFKIPCVKYGVTLVSAYAKTLESDLKQQYIYQDSHKYALSDSSMKFDLAIPFVPIYKPEYNLQQAELRDFTRYHPSE